MDRPGRPCPLCGLVLSPGVPLEVLDRHFQQCSETDDRAAPRREWDEAAAKGDA